ncbi:DRTGG domain-containing protein [Flavonifractor hominis]|uniref:DRTGG domain-containing protein n=1 Tax=Flavonifractor hominis TaxID=3133178 RepID=A0ABV1EUQ7_9FIRM
MRLSDIKRILSATVLCGEDHLDREVFSACGSDFMSDVLAFVKNQALLLTGLVNPQVVRTADMVEMKCIIFVRGKIPGRDILALAEERDIVIMTCPKRMYEACGLLYSNGLRGNCDGNE